MSTVEDPSRRQIKKEVKTEPSENGGVTPEVSASMDFNRLYGDLYQKLLNTPVQEIFPHNSSVPPPTTNGKKDFRHEDPMKMFSQSLPEDGTGKLPPDVLKSSQMNGGMFHHGLGSPVSQNPPDFDPLRYIGGSPAAITQEHMEKIASQHEPIDIPKLVEEFRVSLERYGVSQRFAARFIMHDTSQGNLSFLMEKGKTKGWEELSVRGRIPYIKMKAWLESKDQQIMTLDMIKQSQEMKKYSPREPYSRRERFSMFQLQVLCHLFEENPNPPMNTRSAVAQSLNIPLDRVNVWFQNQRARGFPAKKILQNSMYNEGVSSEKNENFADGRFSPDERKGSPLMREKHFPTMDGFPGGGDPFALLQNFTSSKLGEPQVKTEKYQGHTPHKPSMPLATSNMTRPSMTPPIDFSTFPFTHNSPIGQSTSGLENFPLNQTYTDNQSTAAESKAGKAASNVSQSTPPQSSGASKRKRGKRPQQIVRAPSPDLPDEWKTNQNNPNPDNKRVKLSEPEYRFGLTSNQNDNSDDTQKLSDNKCNGFNGFDSQNNKQSNDVTDLRTNQFTGTNDVIRGFTNKIVDNDEDDISKTFIAIKSVCAHILNEEKAEKVKDNVRFEEPDLD